MLAFFRRLINSKIGALIFVAILLAFALGFGLNSIIGGNTGAPQSAGSDTAVTIGKTRITTTELRQRMTNVLQSQQQRAPGTTMAQLLAAGAYEQVVTALIDQTALAEFGRQQGLVVSKRVVDGQIAGIAAFAGPDGKFSPQVYAQRLAQAGINDAQFRQEFTQEELDQQLRLPIVTVSQVPMQLVLPYARLLLEKRTATIAGIPFGAMPAGAAPTDAELAAYYRQNTTHYMLPERRVMRYAVVSPDALAAQAAPSDAEVAQAFKAQAARFAAKETRDIEQVTVLNQAAANALAAKVKGGGSIAEAAKAAGLSPNTISAAEKAPYAQQTSPEIANAVFAAPQGGVVGPVRGVIGFVVARVAKVTQVPAKTLEQARPDLVKELTQRKEIALMAGIRQRLDAGLNNNAGFGDLVNAAKLTAATTPALAAGGVDPTVPVSAKPDVKMSQIAAAGFAAGPNDAPQLVPVAADGSFALVQLVRVVPAAPRPLAEIRDRITADFRANRARGLARKAAADILAKVEHGTPLTAALAQSGLQLPAPQTITQPRLATVNPRQPAPAAVAMMFALKPGGANMVEDPRAGGFAIVQLTSSTPGDLRSAPALAGTLQGDFAQSVGNEHGQELAAAARQAVHVTRNEAALARLKSELAGTAPPTSTDQQD